MSKKNDIPQTLIEAVRYFSDLDRCHEYMVRVKWPNGEVTCPKCGGDNIGEIKSRRMFQCKSKECRKQFSTKVGTIFEDSALGLDKWFVAVWCIVNAKNGISSHELSRALGVTQKSCWHMLHRVRLAMQTKSFHKLSGEVEVDETLIGGRNANKHKSKRKKNPGNSSKAIVQGMLQRGGEVRCSIARNQGRRAMQTPVRENVAPGSFIYTDQLGSYQSLNDEYVHQCVNHIIEYVRGRVHTNGLENFWSLLKRTLGGTYVAVDPVHLDRYLDEQSWRYNKRKGSDATRFLEALWNVTGKRLRYKELIGTTSEA
jgi:transposase-like protein